MKIINFKSVPIQRELIKWKGWRGPWSRLFVFRYACWVVCRKGLIRALLTEAG